MSTVSDQRHPGLPGPRSALPWVLAAFVVLALLGLLTAQLVLLRAQLRHVSSQDRISKVLLTRADPALAPLPATLRQLAPTLRALRGSDPIRSARLARGLALQAAPVLSTLTTVDLPAFFDQIRGLIGASTTGNRLAKALSATVDFFTAVGQANLIEPLARASALLPAALANVQRALVHLPAALAKIPRVFATLRASKRTQDASLSIQRQSLAIQRQTLVLLQRSLAVQQEVLQHARSLDSKIP